MTELHPDSPFHQLGVTTPGTSADPDAPLTRRAMRERDAAGRGKRSAPSSPSKPPNRVHEAPRTRKVRVKFTRARRPRGSTASKFLSLGALLGAAGLLVGMSVPANAFIASVEGVSTASTERLPGQTMQVSAQAPEQALARDSFEIISYAELLRLKYSGLNYAYTATSGAVRWPFPYAVSITDGFGYREYGEFHNGTDFVPGAGAPIYAIADGVVVEATELQWSFGNHVIIQHNLGGVDVRSLYAHMQSGSSPLTVGTVVKVGDFVGLVGDTGRSYGAHLHLEIHVNGEEVDPFAWLQANAVN